MKIYVGILVGGVVLSLLAAIVYTHLPKPQATLNSSPLNRPPEETISVDKETEKYVNHNFGFEVSYPKTFKSYMANCQMWKENKEGDVEIKYFKDGQNKIYFAPANTLKIGPDNSCSETATTIKTIKEGPSVAFSYAFNKIASDSGLLGFAEKNLGVAGCQIGSKQFVKGTKDTYKITLHSVGNNGAEGGSCWLNFDYQFLYSPTTKTAVISGGYQNCILGTGKMCVPQAKLVD